jgi:hypothetical protein
MLYLIYVRTGKVNTAKVEADSPKEAVSEYLSREGYSHSFSGDEIVFDNSPFKTSPKISATEVNGSSVFHFPVK